MSTLRRLAPVALVLGVLASLFAAVGYSATVTTAVPVPSCTKPTSSPTHLQMVNYMECLQRRTEALLANHDDAAAAPSPTPSTTSTPSPTATSSPSTPSPTATSSPSPTATSSPSPTTAPSPTATSTPSPTPTGDWPNADNTGVPAGVTLGAYTGPCTITSSLTIDAKDVAAKCGELIVRGSATVLKVTRSKLPRVENTDWPDWGTVSIADSEVRSPTFWDGVIWGSNFTVTRSEITGGQHNVHCIDNCTITDSWLHSQYEDPSASFHNNAFISNGGSGYVLRHNTLHCTADLNSNDGGCTADVSLFGDFDPVSDVLVEGNLFKANNRSISYCTHAGYNPGKAYPNSTGIRYIDNVFERGANGKCGVYGPVTSFNGSLSGNVWSGNRWTTGEPVLAS